MLNVCIGKILLIHYTEYAFLFCVTSLGVSVFEAVHGPYIVYGRSRLSAEGTTVYNQ